LNRNMNSASGISASQELVDTFASAVEGVDVRIIKVSIKNESLVPDGVTKRSGSLQNDLKQLAGLVSTDVPAYYLVRLDSSAPEWLAISYVPDTAKVRDKMLYASTRSALTKALGNDRFTDTMFATNENELTAEGYTAHLQHNSAPQPLSVREAEMAKIWAAEKAAGLDAYKGASERKSHVGAVGLSWTDEVEAALNDLAEQSARNTLVLLVSHICSGLRLHVVDEGRLAGDRPGERDPRVERHLPSHSQRSWSLSPQL